MGSREDPVLENEASSAVKVAVSENGNQIGPRRGRTQFSADDSSTGHTFGDGPRGVLGLVQDPRPALGQRTLHRGDRTSFAAVVVGGKEKSLVVVGQWFHFNGDVFRTKK
jgi:hypothetical protein